MVTLSTLDQVEKLLTESQAQFLGGSQPSSDDGEALKSITDCPNPGAHPRAFAWFALVSKFTPEARAAWTQSGGSLLVAPTNKPAGGKAPATDSSKSAAAAGGEGGEGKKKKEKAKGPSAKDLKKMERLRKKQEEEAKKNELVKDPNDPAADRFGEMELIRSQCDPELRHERKYTAVKDLNDDLIGQVVRIRARVSNTRKQGGSLTFLVLRESYATAQCVVFAGAEGNSKGMVAYSSKIPKESIIEIVAEATKPDKPIDSVSQQIELQVKEVWVVNKSVPILPFQIEDASRLVLN